MIYTFYDIVQIRIESFLIIFFQNIFLYISEKYQNILRIILENLSRVAFSLSSESRWRDVGAAFLGKNIFNDGDGILFRGEYAMADLWERICYGYIRQWIFSDDLFGGGFL